MFQPGIFWSPTCSKKFSKSGTGYTNAANLPLGFPTRTLKLSGPEKKGLLNDREAREILSKAEL